MSNSLVALQAQAPDVMNSFNAGQKQALGVQREKREAAQQALESVGAVALGAMGGDINGQADPQKFEQGLDMLEGMGMDVGRFRGRPDAAPVAARASMSALQQLKMVQDDKQLEFLMQKFDADLAQWGAEYGLRKEELAAKNLPNVPSGYQPAPGGGLAAIPGGPADPNNPINTRKTSGPSLSANAQKELFEADEAVEAGKNVLLSLDEALGINEKALYGPAAETRGKITSWFGSESGEATEQLRNIVTTQALDNLKAIFGGMPTEGERKILLEIQGSVDKAPNVRKEIFERAKKSAERRIAINVEKAKRLRSGEYFTESPGDAPPALAESDLPRKTIGGVTYEQGEDGEWYEAE